jgi:lambda family phage tail tape measure protein
MRVDESKQFAETMKKEIDRMKELNATMADGIDIRASFVEGGRAESDEIKFQISLLGKSIEQQQRMNEQRRIDLEFRQQAAALARTFAGNPEEFERAITQLEQDAVRRKGIADQLTVDRLTAEKNWVTGAARFFNDYQTMVEDSATMTRDLFTNAFRSMEDALVNFVKTGKIDFKSLADSIVADILRIQIRQNITGPLAQSMGGSSGVMSWLGQLFGGGAAAAGPTAAETTAFWGMGLATGGTANYGQSYLVGERGPELFVPDVSGTIIPNHALSGGSNVTVIQNIQTPDIASFRASSSQIASNAGRQIQQALRRNG